VLFGLGHEVERAGVIRAVLEGVAFALADGADALREVGGSLGALTAIGGGARSRFWLQLIATALNTPLLVGEDADVGPALGAARLARLAVTGEPPEAVCTAPRDLAVVEPEPRLADDLARRRAVHQRLYPDLRPAFAESRAQHARTA
jgi:xylulokinase